MRISKDPKVRKQEIIDTAMKLFSKKGYEFTSMSDIAKEMNVVSGLCYRYFKSKEDLYKTAINLYAQECSAPIIKILSDDYNSLEELLDIMSRYFVSTDNSGKYHTLFHKKNNKLFHKQLELLMIKLILPHFIELLTKFQERNIINIDINNIEYTCDFILHGQMPIINNDSLETHKKIELITSMILKVLK